MLGLKRLRQSDTFLTLRAAKINTVLSSDEKMRCAEKEKEKWNPVKYWRLENYRRFTLTWPHSLPLSPSLLSHDMICAVKECVMGV